mgnify:FL=1
MITNTVMVAAVREYNYLNRREALQNAILKAKDPEFKEIWKIKLKQLEVSRDKLTK